MSGVRTVYSKVIDAVIESATDPIVIDTNGCNVLSYTFTATVVSTAKTASCGVLSTKIIQDLTYTAVADSNAKDSNGNNITITYTSGGTAGSEIVTVVGTAISIQIASGVSTANQIRTAFNSSTAATNLASCTVSGTGTNTQTAVVATPLAGGVDSSFNPALDTITITSHGFFTGLKLQVTKSGASFPGGISGSTNYYVYVIDSNTIQLFDTLSHSLNANSNIGIIDITSDGTPSSTITLTPVSLTGANIISKHTNDYDPITGTGNWVTRNTTAITTSVVSQLTTLPVVRYYNWSFSCTTGSVAVRVVFYSVAGA